MTPDHPAPLAPCDDNDEDNDNDVHEREQQEEEGKGPVAVAMASATRSLLHGLRHTSTVPLRNLVKDAMKKNAFLAIGRRTTAARPASSALPAAAMITKQPTTSYWERAVGTYVVGCVSKRTRFVFPCKD
jgi:hypothetical protein